MKDDFLILTCRPGSMRRSGIYPTCVSRYRRNLRRPKTGLPDGFPEYKDVYWDLKAVSGRMVLQVAPLPEDICKLGVEGVNRIWREAKRWQ